MTNRTKEVTMAAKSAHQLLGHAVVGTNDLATAANFYDKLFALFGVGRILEQPGRAIYFGTTGLEFGVTNPYNGKDATIGNGNMVALSARSRAHVDEVHALALKLGGTDEGKPGPRGPNEDGPYCAYFRDLDGNKLLVFRAGPDEA
ncbi:VOC family protein [Sinorhizobium terangae]|uniref:VOC family protein n=1 Tax=Sinorhizobium terangae TaxID=110322 RepID=A0A6N7LD81_SINTE|nr:VOC family protein [Sinorhizobium terangae]MBB4185777.1 catechol 2,3-dioxygenase-like lactoylglutathione lyase family enzyme [Sinorhizobium terangae]MQX15576.1 VOC family protein [Sinorhizobium terangae]WFU46173.1 VOC family protein [Sinorhizobium terangae]